MMRRHNMGYSIRQAFSQMGRNKGMYFTTILAITAMMLILGLFFVAFVNIDMFTVTIENDYNVIQVYLSDDNDAVANESVGNALSSMDGVTDATYITKKQALETLRQRWGDNGYLLDNLQKNPLPNYYMVYVADNEAAGRVADAARGINGVDDVVYYQDTIDKLAKVTNFVEIGSLVCMIFLIVISVIIVANTIKLTVFNKAKEIGIMKYLGATDSFVRRPFVINGVLIGLLSSAIATGLVYLIYNKVIDLVGMDIARMLSVTVVPANYLIWNLLIIFICLGVGIGTTGSIISIRRFLFK